MGEIVWFLAAAAVVGLVVGGSFDPMTSSPEGLLSRASRNNHHFSPDMSEDKIFEMFFPPRAYLLKPEELEENQPQPAEDESTGLATGEEDDEDEDDDEVAGRGIGSGAKYVIKQIGKVGLNLLKRGIKFLRSTFFKFGGKRLLKRAKKYLKEEAFTLEPLSCEGANCTSCAVFTLPFKVKQFKACAEMGVTREKNKNGHMMTNFVVGMSVVKKDLFSRAFEVGDIANCFQLGSDPDGRAGLAALVGKVCVQGFEFSVNTDKTGKFCLALVFKRWATGYRFCAQRVNKKEKKDDKGDKADNKRVNKGNGKKTAEKDKYSSRGNVTDKKKKQWKVELKRISAGEQDGQIVSDQPLFKNEAKVRQQHSEKVLKEGVPA